MCISIDAWNLWLIFGCLGKILDYYSFFSYTVRWLIRYRYHQFVNSKSPSIILKGSLSSLYPPLRLSTQETLRNTFTRRENPPLTPMDRKLSLEDNPVCCHGDHCYGDRLLLRQLRWWFFVARYMSYEVVTKTLGDLYQESQQVSASPLVPVKPGPPAPATIPQRIDPMEEVIRNLENTCTVVDLCVCTIVYM